MRTVEEIKKKIGEIENDGRYQAGKRKPATIDINAPLALCQLVMETQIATLNWVLKDPEEVPANAREK